MYICSSSISDSSASLIKVHLVYIALFLHTKVLLNHKPAYESLLNFYLPTHMQISHQIKFVYIVLHIPVAWSSAPLFGPVSQIRTTLTLMKPSLRTHICTGPLGSRTVMLGVSKMNAGTVCVWVYGCVFGGYRWHHVTGAYTQFLLGTCKAIDSYISGERPYDCKVSLPKSKERLCTIDLICHSL